MKKIQIILSCLILSLGSFTSVYAEDTEAGTQEQVFEGETAGDETDEISSDEVTVYEEEQEPEEIVTEELISPEDNEETVPQESEEPETEETAPESISDVRETVQDAEPVQNADSQEAAGEEDENQETPEEADEENEEPETDYELSYRAHVSNIGWMASVNDPETAGVIGQNLEALEVSLAEQLKPQGELYVQAHVSNVGWQTAAGSGETSGTTGQSKSIEAVRIYLGGELAEKYDIYYRAYSAGYGWLGWTVNGGIAGTVGCGKAVQAIEIDLLKKEETGYSLTQSYIADVQIPEELTVQAHVSNIGWMVEVGNDSVAGTTGQSRRLEALKITLPVSMQAEGNIAVQAHVETYGWRTTVSSGTTAGVTGQSKAMEAIRIYLTGGLAEKYDIWYRVHSSQIGWLGWTRNGGVAGTTGYGYAMEAIQIDLQPKGLSVHAETQAYRSAKAVFKEITLEAHVSNIGWMSSVGNDQVAGTTGRNLKMEGIRVTLPVEMLESGNISAQAYVQNRGWLGAVNSGRLAGTVGQGLRLEAYRLSLTGELANRYDVYYRAHVSGTGWLGWTKNGGTCGSMGWSKSIEALQICFVLKGINSYQTGNAFIDPPKQFTPVYYSQRDSRWADAQFGAWNVYSAGCVPTSLAMILSGLSGKSILPLDVASWLYYNTVEYNHRSIGGGGLCAQYAAEHWGFQWKGLSSATALANELSIGRLVIGYQGPGLFAKPGASHAVVMFKNSAGRTYIYDPWDSGRNGWYSISTLWSQRSTDPDDNKGGYVYYSIYY